MRSHAKASFSRSNLHLVLLVFAVASLLLPAMANAAPPITFAGPGSDAGEIDAPNGVAVDQASGDVYIAENNNVRISKFDSEGNFLLAWGYAVADPNTLTLQTCGPEASPPTVRCFSGKGNSDLGPGSGNPVGVAVDPATGEVYVRDGFRVEKFSPEGEFLLMFGKDVNVTPGTPHPNLCTAADVTAGDTCVWGVAGTEPGELESGRTLAVDASGSIWVGGNDRLQKFNTDGTFSSQIALPGAGQTSSLALDSADNFYVKSAAFPGIRKLEAGTGALLETFDAGGNALTAAVDGSGNVYVGDGTAPYRFLVFNPAGEQTAQFGAGQVIGVPGGEFGGTGIAFGHTTGALYSISMRPNQNSAAQIFSPPGPGPLPGNERAEDVLPTTATLKASLNPEDDATTYFFEYGTDTSYGQSTPVAALSGSGFEEEDIEAAIDHLLPGTIYHFRVVATNHCNEAEPAEECTVNGEDATFTTLPAIEVNEQQATDITATTATFRAKLDPLGAPATWWVEYGTDTSYGSATPERSLGSSFGDIAVQAGVEGLAPGTTYHYRFVARDERDGVTYTVHGVDRTILTEVSGIGFRLADSRVWEMVSPPSKRGALLSKMQGGLIQASQSGEAITYSSLGSIEANPNGNRAPESSAVVSRRGPAGWHSQDISPPHSSVTPAGVSGWEFKLFREDFSGALFEQRDFLPLSPAASDRTLYLREGSEPVTYLPLVTSKEGYANVPPGTEIGGPLSKASPFVFIAGSSPDLRHVVVSSERPLETSGPSNALYRWASGELVPASVLPGGEGGNVVPAMLGTQQGSVEHAISDDGSRVFWSTGDYAVTGVGTLGLYVFDHSAEESARLDVVQPGASGLGVASPAFQGASVDGTRVLFTDSRQLTEDASTEGRSLYSCEVGTVGASLGCASLTNISVPVAGSDESARVTGLMPALSDDARRAYFIAKGVLDSKPNQRGETAVAGEPNLYSWSDGEPSRFIATLSPSDGQNWGEVVLDEAVGYAGRLSAAGSPSGRYFSFMSERSLTGYENRDAVSGEPAQEVFLYDSATDRLECVSCNPTGASPKGQDVEANSLADPRGIWTGRRVAAVLPQNPVTGGFAFLYPLYRPRTVLDNGRVFFNAIDALVPADSNGEWDVYQHEPLGVGDCTASAGKASTSRSGSGCVSLISSGVAEDETVFLDAGATGRDAFLLTRARLSVLDTDSEYDVYDARVDGVAATLPPNTECLGEACQPAVVAPDDPTPASAGFRGPGDLRAKPVRRRCSKGKRVIRRKGKARCVTRKGKGGKQRERRAGHERRAGR